MGAEIISGKCMHWNQHFWILPLPVKFTYYISEMIHLEGSPDDVFDRDLVKKTIREFGTSAHK
jgi:hypothetical protein